jgi:DHA2 family multidrug resistance protein
MRNLGGSVGIAMVATMLSRDTQIHTNILGAHISMLDPQTRAAVNSTRSLFLSRGSDWFTATQQAYAALWGNVVRQATMIAFIDIFRLLTLVFLCAIPLVLLMQRAKSGTRSQAGAH